MTLWSFSQKVRNPPRLSSGTDAMDNSPIVTNYYFGVVNGITVDSDLHQFDCTVVVTLYLLDLLQIPVQLYYYYPPFTATLDTLNG